MIYDKDISHAKMDEIISCIEQRLNGKPLAYITGFKEFWTLNLKVNEHTLIPRPETEQIVELILQNTPENFQGKILDLGTGTGAIALSVAKERPKAEIVAVDISSDCIKVAQFNCQKYNLKNVKILQSNWFESLTGQKFDFILSNPPYIDPEDEHLENLKYEPITALSSSAKGYADLFHLINQANLHLNDDGILMFEHGYNQKEVLIQNLQENAFSEIKSHLDLAKIPRIISAKIH